MFMVHAAFHNKQFNVVINDQVDGKCETNPRKLKPKTYTIRSPTAKLKPAVLEVN